MAMVNNQRVIKVCFYAFYTHLAESAHVHEDHCEDTNQNAPGPKFGHRSHQLCTVCTVIDNRLQNVILCVCVLPSIKKITFKSEAQNFNL